MKYMYNGMSLKKYCNEKGISYHKILREMKKYNISIEIALISEPKRAGKRVIDLENLEIWDSLTSCAKQLNTTAQSVCYAIKNGQRVKGHRIEYFDWWISHNKNKENY